MEPSTPLPLDHSQSPSSNAERIAAAFGAPLASVQAAIGLLQDGYQPSFIARHRKAQTKGLTTADLVRVDTMHRYLLGVEAARQAALAALAEGGPAGAEVVAAMEHADSRFDIADIAAEALSARTHGGTAPIADRRAMRAAVRAAVWERGSVVVTATDAAKAQAAEQSPHPYEQLFALNEKIGLIPANRYLAVCRGEAEGALAVAIEPDLDHVGNAFKRVAAQLGQADPAPELQSALPALLAAAYADVRAELRERSELTSIDGLAEHVRKLLVMPPVGKHPVVAVVGKLSGPSHAVALDEAGQPVATQLVAADPDGTAFTGFVEFVTQHRASVVAISNGPGGMEFYVGLRKHLRANPVSDMAPIVVVEDAGTTEYGTSEVARLELAHVDLSLRGVVWLGRRMQDPVCELVKVDPLVLAGPSDHPGRMAAGLARHLGLVLTEAITELGVDLNAASAEQLSYVVGLDAAMAAKIVAHRNVVGTFRHRDELMQVGGMTPLAYEQAASFLRVVGGGEPLDQTRLHPDQYELARAVAAQVGAPMHELIGDRQRLRDIDPASLVTPTRGRGLVAWLLAELGAPWRDRRPAFVPPTRREDLIDIHDLKPGMEIEGHVASVAPFGVFVDLGIYHDGLVHISQLLKRFGNQAASIARVGHPLRVSVVDVDVPRKRISLLPLPPQPQPRAAKPRKAGEPKAPKIAQKHTSEASPQLLAALAKPVAAPMRQSAAKTAGDSGATPAAARIPRGKGGSSLGSVPGPRGRGRNPEVAPPQPAGPGIGIAGFTNSPFAKLANLKK